MPSTLTTFDPFLKLQFDDEEVVRIVCKNRPSLAKFTAGKKRGSGKLWIVPAVIGNPQGHGATLAKAQTGAAQTSGGNVVGKQWQIAWGDYDSNVQIGDKVIQASRDNVGAFFENETAEIKGLYDGFADTMAYYAISDSGRSLTPGTFTVHVSSGLCTLANPDDIVNIAVGQIVVVSANDGTDASHVIISASGVGYVVAINPNAGTFTVSTSSGGAGATPANWTGTMYAFRDGDFGGSGATRIMLGLSAWVPLADPGATAFEGVVRTTSITALSGVRLTSTEIAGIGIEQRLKKLCTRMAGRAMGPGPTDIFLNPEKWQVLADSLEARGTRPLDGKIGVFNYQKIQIAAGGNLVDVWSDRFVPIGRAFAVNMDYVELRSLSGFPAVLNDDGMQMLRMVSANDYEMRLVAYPAFCVRAPGYCGVVAV
jgi:hypothetical protein